MASVGGYCRASGFGDSTNSGAVMPAVAGGPSGSSASPAAVETAGFAAGAGAGAEADTLVAGAACDGNGSAAGPGTAGTDGTSSPAGAFVGALVAGVSVAALLGLLIGTGVGAYVAERDGGTAGAFGSIMNSISCGQKKGTYRIVAVFLFVVV